MIATILLFRLLLVLASLTIARAIWWLVGDVVLEHVGVPFVDRRRRDTAVDWRGSSPRRPAHVHRPSERRDGGVRRPGYERDKRRTGMSRDVRA